MRAYLQQKFPVNEIKKFIVIFYIIGIIGFIIPLTRPFFTSITPFALLLSIALLALYHPIFTIKELLIFIIICLAGYFIEVIGVKTGFIFGSYKYGNGLGLKVFETPLLIGVNWFYVAYISLSIVGRYRLNTWFIVLFTPLLMLAYDIILEQIAPHLDMWSWVGNTVPMRNYVAWYIIGLLFIALLKLFKIESRNPIAKILFISQFLFFVLLFLFFKLT